MSAPNTPVVVARDGPVSPPLGTTGLRAITVPLGSEPVDLVEVAGQQGIFWQHDGAGLAGRGVAATIDLDNGLGPAATTSRATPAAGPTTGRPTTGRPATGRPTAGGPAAAATVMAALAQIVTDDPLGWSGTGPVALGALPFDRSAPATLVIPSVLVGRDREGRQWLTLVAPEDVGFELDTRGAEELVGDLIGAAGGPGRSPRAGKVWSPDQFTLISPRTHEEWCDVVRRATEAIERGDFRKVVLAREITVEANRPFVLGDVLRRLLLLHPACMVFAMDGFVGASPELLVGRHGRTVRSHPLAGTISRSGDIDTDAALAAALLASPKDRREHGLVVDAVAHALEPFCDRLDVPGEPSIVALRNVAHLGTSVTGDLRPTAPASALELVDALHPTPAVGGTPAEAALAFLERHEGLARERYAGPVGWMDRRGDGEWAVAIRSAEIDGKRARLFAGVGVVAGSDPEAELAETQLKLQALLAALVRP